MKKKLLILTLLFTLVIGIIPVSAKSKKVKTVDIGYYDGLEQIFHKFDAIEENSTVYMYPGQYLWFKELSVFDAKSSDDNIVTAWAGSYNNYILANNTGEATVTLYFDPEDESDSITFEVSVIAQETAEEMLKQLSKCKITAKSIKLTPADEYKYSGKVTFNISKPKKAVKELQIKFIDACGKDDDSKWYKITSDSKKVKITFKNIYAYSEHFDEYFYGLTSKLRKKLENGNSVTVKKFLFEYVIKYNGLYFY